MILGVGLANGLDWVDDKYSIREKVKAYFSSASKDAPKNESVKRCEREFERDVPVSQNSRYFVTCPFAVLSLMSRNLAHAILCSTASVPIPIVCGFFVSRIATEEEK